MAGAQEAGAFSNVMGVEVRALVGLGDGGGPRRLAEKKPMSPVKRFYNLALVGAGRQGLAILEALVPPRRKDQGLFIIGVADRDPEAPGLKYAMKHGLYVTSDYHDLYHLPNLDIIVNATGDGRWPKI